VNEDVRGSTAAKVVQMDLENPLIFTIFYYLIMGLFGVTIIAGVWYVFYKHKRLDREDRARETDMLNLMSGGEDFQAYVAILKEETEKRRAAEMEAVWGKDENQSEPESGENGADSIEKETKTD
jgi:hypothetical protein